jgi:hypothetical protein
MKKFDRIIASTLAGTLGFSTLFPNIKAEAKPKDNDNGPTISGKLKKPLRWLDRRGGDLIQGGQNVIEDSKNGRKQRKIKECTSINYNSRQCQKLLKQIRN